MTVNVGVIGVGYWGPNLVRNFSSLPDVRVVALCDTNVEHAARVAVSHCPSAAVVADYKEIGDDPAIDAAVVATPIPTHFELAKFLLERGKHVFVEKPLAKTSTQCRALIDLAKAGDRVLMVGHVFEYNAAVRQIKGYIEQGQLGQIFYVYSQRVNLGRIQHDVNALWSFAPHDISIINYWLSDFVTRIAAQGFSFLSEGVEDVVFVTLEYSSGVKAHLHLGWLDPRKIRLMTLVGSKKMLVYDDVSVESKIRIYDKGVKRLDEYLCSPESFAEFQFQTRTGDVVIPRIRFEEPLQTECRHFIDCVNNGKEPLSDGESGLRVVRVLEAADVSMSNGGRAVDL